MTALKAAQVDAFVAKPNPAQPVVLVYGADAGLVRERAEALVRASVDDLNDPFSLVRLEGDQVASEPSRLVEEANTIPLFGGKRAVWVKAGARNLATMISQRHGLPELLGRILAARGIGSVVVRHLTILFDVLRRRADQRLMGCDAAVGSTLQLVALIKGRVQRGVALSLAATSLLNICTEARWVA